MINYDEMFFKNLENHEIKINYVEEIRMITLFTNCRRKMTTEKCTNKNKKFINRYQLFAV
jgi:hypothetical protein